MKHMKTLLLFVLASALLAFSGCGAEKDPAEGAEPETQETVRIATKPMTEQYILGEMLGLIIEQDTGARVELTKGIGGGTNNIHPAMVNGDFDLYPEYTSSGWVMVLDHSPEDVSDDEMFASLQREYHDSFGMTWLGLYGFNNTYAVAVRGEAAREYNLKTTSDLAAVSDKLIFGGNPDYIEREDGFKALCDTYGLSFKEVRDIDIGLKYTALINGEIDVTNAFTTDAQLGNDANDIVVLEDDQHLQVNYFCSTVVREDALARVPGLEAALMKMDGLITDSEMAHLNYLVEVEGADEREVAREYLTEKGIL